MTDNKKYGKTAIITFVFMAAIISSLFWPVSNLIRAASASLIALVFAYIRRSYIIYTHCVRMLRDKGPSDKVWKGFESCIRNGIDLRYRCSIGSIMAQNGYVERGAEILEKIIEEEKGSQTALVAATSLSMGYWVDGQTDKATEVLERFRKQGNIDRSIFVNLATYYLSDFNVQQAKKVITDAKKLGYESTGMKDNYLWYYIMTDDWDNAEKESCDLQGESNVPFPDAYVHSAQVELHNGNIDKALDLLDIALTKQFSSTCVFTKDYIQGLRDGIADSSSSAYLVQLLEANKNLVSAGKPYVTEDIK